MVSSTASPMAILAIRLVTIESSMPSHPIILELIIMGNKLGMMSINPTLLDISGYFLNWISLGVNCKLTSVGPFKAF